MVRAEWRGRSRAGGRSRMNDEPGLPAEPPLVDARSPAERWAEAGRANFERVRALIDDGHLDTAALAWMGFVIAYSVVEAYSALRASGFGDNSGSTDWWTRLQLLTNSGGIVLVFGAMIGIVLAVFFYGPASRLALRIAVGGGVWAVITALIGVAVAFHDSNGSFANFQQPGTEAKIVSALGSLSVGGFGLVIAVVAWRVARPVVAQAPSGPAANRTGPEIVELS